MNSTFSLVFWTYLHGFNIKLELLFLEVLNSSWIYPITSKVHFVKGLTNYIKITLTTSIFFPPTFDLLLLFSNYLLFPLHKLDLNRCSTSLFLLRVDWRTYNIENGSTTELSLSLSLSLSLNVVQRNWRILF